MKVDHEENKYCEEDPREFTLQVPEILCREGHRVVKMSTDPNCPMALLCGDPICKSCSQPSPSEDLSISLPDLTKNLNIERQEYKGFIDELIRIDKEFIRVLEDNVTQLTSRLHYDCLQSNMVKVVSQIYQKKNSNEVSGVEGKMLVDHLKELRQRGKQKSAHLLYIYSNEVKKMMTSIIDLKKELQFNYLEEWMRIDSKIINEDTNIQNYQFLKESLGNPPKLQLIFRASEHAFKAAAFHQICGNVKNTLTLVRTQFGKTLAGFTPYSWHSVPEGTSVSNPAGGTFILALQLKEKLIPLKTDTLISNFAEFGPVFGGYSDMGIADSSNMDQSYAGIICAYNTSSKKFTSNQATWTAFSGAPKGYLFKVTEYQVFRVIKQNR